MGAEDEAARLARVRNAAHCLQPAALCLSGGGIRSAAFALGILQALARADLLTRFHYLSTVSGGRLYRFVAVGLDLLGRRLASGRGRTARGSGARKRTAADQPYPSIQQLLDAAGRSPVERHLGGRRDLWPQPRSELAHFDARSMAAGFGAEGDRRRDPDGAGRNATGSSRAIALAAAALCMIAASWYTTLGRVSDRSSCLFGWTAQTSFLVAGLLPLIVAGAIATSLINQPLHYVGWLNSGIKPLLLLAGSMALVYLLGFLLAIPGQIHPPNGRQAAVQWGRDAAAWVAAGLTCGAILWVGVRGYIRTPDLHPGGRSGSSSAGLRRLRRRAQRVDRSGRQVGARRLRPAVLFLRRVDGPARVRAAPQLQSARGFRARVAGPCVRLADRGWPRLVRLARHWYCSRPRQ